MFETVAAGRPITTFNAGVAPRVINDGMDGYLADNLNDFERFLKHLLLDDGERAKVSRRAFSSPVPAAYQWDQIAGRFSEEFFGTVQRS